MVFGRKRNDSPMKNSIIAAPSQGFHMFQAQTENLCLLNETTQKK